MLLRTLQAPPRTGSLLEWVLILTLDRLEDVEHARFRALAQLIVDKDQGVEAFEDYMRIAFPAMEARKQTRSNMAKELLAQELARGPLKVTPLATPWKSKLRQRVSATKASKELSERHERIDQKWQRRK
jgi:hypothetical protein